MLLGHGVHEPYEEGSRAVTQVADAHELVTGAGDGPDALLREFPSTQQGTGLLQEDLTGICQLDAVRVAHEEERAERFLERGHVTADDRAAHEEVLRGAPEAQAACQVDKLVKILEIHLITRIGSRGLHGILIRGLLELVLALGAANLEVEQQSATNQQHDHDDENYEVVAHGLVLSLKPYPSISR